MSARKKQLTLREFLAWLEGFRDEHAQVIDFIPIYDALDEVLTQARKMQPPAPLAQSSREGRRRKRT